MKTRSYTMGARQTAKDATRDAIINAAIDTFMAERSFAITLPAVAERADVTVKTVLRHFGGRDALIEAAWSRAYEDVVAERTPPSPNPKPRWVCSSTTTSAAATWCSPSSPRRTTTPAPEDEQHGTAGTSRVGGGGLRLSLPEEPAARSRLIDVLVVATDVYCWKLLRLDRGLSVDDVLDRMLLMTGALLEAP